MFEAPPVGVQTATIISPHDDGCHHAIFLADIVNDTLDLRVAKIARWLYAIREETGPSWDTSRSVNVALGDEVDGGETETDLDLVEPKLEVKRESGRRDDPSVDPDCHGMVRDKQSFHFAYLVSLGTRPVYTAQLSTLFLLSYPLVHHRAFYVAHQSSVFICLVVTARCLS